MIFSPPFTSRWLFLSRVTFLLVDFRSAWLIIFLRFCNCSYTDLISESSLYIEIKLFNGMEYFMSRLKNFSIDGVNKINADIDSEQIKYIIEHYDLIYYTIPANILTDTLKLNINVNIKKLYIYKFRITDNKINQRLWWDYVYFPEGKFPFHRISKHIEDNNSVVIDVETNEDSTLNISMEEYIFNFLKQYGVLKIEIEFMEMITLNGHLSTNIELQRLVPGNIKLVGRFAELNSILTMDKVIDKMYNNKYELFKELL